MMPPMTHRKGPAEQYASYLIRFWREIKAPAADQWRAQVESIQSGQTWRFSDLDALVDFLNKTFPPLPGTDP